MKSTGDSDLKLNELATEAEKSGRASCSKRRRQISSTAETNTVENLESKIEKVNRTISTSVPVWLGA